MLNKKEDYITIPILIFTLGFISNAHGFTSEEEQWLNSEDDSDVSHINEGKLEFISAKNNEMSLHSINTLTINQKSIESGWVNLNQCYRHLDKIEEVEITYKYRFMKELTLLSKQNIESAIVKDQNIELKNVNNNAELCVSAKVRIFYQNPDLSYSLVNGPYHRRFLDGYYPYHVSLNIHYPENLLLFKDSTPKQQKGFSIVKTKNKLMIDSYFEGILNTEMKFISIKK